MDSFDAQTSIARIRAGQLPEADAERQLHALLKATGTVALVTVDAGGKAHTRHVDMPALNITTSETWADYQARSAAAKGPAAKVTVGTVDNPFRNKHFRLSAVEKIEFREINGVRRATAYSFPYPGPDGRMTQDECRGLPSAVLARLLEPLADSTDTEPVPAGEPAQAEPAAPASDSN